MTKRGRTVLFLIGASICNIALTLALFVGIVALYGATLNHVLPLGSGGVVIAVAFVMAIVLSSIAYRQVLMLLRKRVDFEGKFGLK
jgi:hypothetical protein